MDSALNPIFYRMVRLLPYAAAKKQPRFLNPGIGCIRQLHYKKQNYKLIELSPLVTRSRGFYIPSECLETPFTALYNIDYRHFQLLDTLKLKISGFKI